LAQWKFPNNFLIPGKLRIIGQERKDLKEKNGRNFLNLDFVPEGITGNLF